MQIVPPSLPCLPVRIGCWRASAVEGGRAGLVSIGMLREGYRDRRVRAGGEEG